MANIQQKAPKNAENSAQLKEDQEKQKHMKFPHFDFGCFFGGRKHKTNPFSFNSLSHYDLFGVYAFADDDEIRKQYLKLMLIFHPDKNGDGQKMAQILNHAYTTLSDKEKRFHYFWTGQNKRETNDEEHEDEASETPGKRKFAKAKRRESQQHDQPGQDGNAENGQQTGESSNGNHGSDQGPFAGGNAEQKHAQAGDDPTGAHGQAEQGEQQHGQAGTSGGGANGRQEQAGGGKQQEQGQQQRTELPEMPEHEEEQFTYYELFGVSPSADVDEIHRMYTKLMAIYKSDDNGVKMRQILTHAYNAMVDPQTRADYERGSTQSSAGNNQTSEDLALALASLAIEN